MKLINQLKRFLGFEESLREVFVVVYDEVDKTLSTPTFRTLQEAFQQQRGFNTLNVRVRSLLQSPGDTQTVIRKVTEFRKVANGAVERHYLFVSGYNFMFKARLGRDFFDVKTTDLSAKFGREVGSHLEEMLERELPDFVLVRA